ncbi:Stromal membrane-associated protein [Schistosoma japonicum]|nr:Stromal membrane-associated protein [Schistosoma japonicum]
MNPVEAKSLNGPSQFIPASNFAIWPENNTSTYSPAAAQPKQNVIPNQFGSFVGTIPVNCNPNNPCTNTPTQSWNMNQPFGNFVSHSANNMVRNNEMYSSQVKGQLTSLYLGESSLNP